MLYNKKYGRRVGDDKIEYAPDYTVVNGKRIIHPTAEDYLRNDPPYRKVKDEAPAPSEGHYVVPVDWEENNTEIVRVYEEREIVTPPRVFSKLKCYGALVKLEMWDRVETWLKESNLWMAFVLAQNVSEDNEMFVRGLETMKAAFGLTDEQVEAILSQCVEDAQC